MAFVRNQVSSNWTFEEWPLTFSVVSAPFSYLISALWENNIFLLFTDDPSYVTCMNILTADFAVQVAVHSLTIC